MGRKNSIRAENDLPAEHSSPELHKTRIVLQRKRDCSLGQSHKEVISM